MRSAISMRSAVPRLHRVALAALAVLFSQVLRAEPFVFEQTRQGMTFLVDSPNDSSINQVSIRARTLTDAMEELRVEADGTVTGAAIDDLNADGFPELYIHVTSAGSGSYGSLIAFASNRNKSLSPIYLPPLSDNPDVARGYMGHDQFTVADATLLRRFPIYLDGDTNAAPSGGVREIRYRLEPGEAGWVLRVDRVDAY